VILALPGNPVSALTGCTRFSDPGAAVALGCPSVATPRVMDDRTQQLLQFTRHLPVTLRADGRPSLPPPATAAISSACSRAMDSVTLPTARLACSAFPSPPGYECQLHPIFTTVRDGQPTMVDITGKAPTAAPPSPRRASNWARKSSARLQNNDSPGPERTGFPNRDSSRHHGREENQRADPVLPSAAGGNCAFQIIPDETGIAIRCEVSTTGKTGVEMEA
jgi:hypothetical protein